MRLATVCSRPLLARHGCMGPTLRFAAAAAGGSWRWLGSAARGPARFAMAASSAPWRSHSLNSVATRAFSSVPEPAPHTDKEAQLTAPPPPPRSVALSIVRNVGIAFLSLMKSSKMITLASMGVSSVAYSFVFGWPYAFGIVGTIFVHEAGHALAMRIRGIPFGPAVFIPFIGAFVSAKQPFKSASEMAFVALAGPAVGLVGAACASLYGIHTGNMLVIHLANFGYFINLINLLPLGNFDGGMVLGALSRWLLVAGIGGGVFCVLNGFTHPMFILALLLATYTTILRFIGGAALPTPGFYALTGTQRLIIAAAYAIVLFLLFTGMQINKRHMAPLDVVRAEQEARGRTVGDSVMVQMADEKRVSAWFKAQSDKFAATVAYIRDRVRA